MGGYDVVLLDVFVLGGDDAAQVEIDGTVYVAPDRILKVGEFATVRVTRAGTHDLWAEVA